MNSKHLRILVQVLFISFISAGCSANDNSSTIIKNDSLYDRVIRTGKIRCAYSVCPPACVKDPNTGKLSGAAVEIMELIAKKLGLTVEYPEEVGWATGLEGLATKRYDLIVTPLWTNENRAKIVSFSKPLWFNPVFAYVRKDDTRFKNDIKRIDASDVVVSTMDGEAGQVIANSDFPKSRRFDLPQTSDLAQLLLNVVHIKQMLSCAIRYTLVFLNATIRII